MTIPQKTAVKAACQGEDPELFQSEDAYGIAAAKTVCYSCPIRGACLTDAMINDEPVGIWGGHTRAEREQYESDWTAIHRKNLPLLKGVYRRHNMHGRHVPRLEKSMLARRSITPILPRYDDYREVLDAIIGNPEMTTEHIAIRINRSRTWFVQTLKEAWEKAS